MFRNRMPHYEVLSADALATLDKGWRRLVTELGVEFMSQRALDLLAAEGQQVEGNNVKFDPDWILAQVAKAPREFDLLKQKGKLRELGIRKSRMRGLGTEFESLRDYADGDDFRKLDWKASARRGELTIRQYEQERNQPVILCIDIGRRMLSEVE